MERRRRDKGIEEAVVGVAAMLCLGVIFIPGLGLILLFFVLAVLGISAIAGVVFLLIRHQRNESRGTASPPLTGYYDNAQKPPASQKFTPPPAIDLTQQLRALDWFQFEKIVELTYRKLGYAVTRRGGANPDGGIDLVIEKDAQRKAIQCKQWKTWNVGVKPVREFLGALTDSGIPSGIFVTLGGYTGDAKALAEKHGIEILNEKRLAQMLDSVNAKYDPEIIAALQNSQKYCPKCERMMVIRTTKKGLGSGNQFWGCSGYPACRFTMPV